MQAKYNPEFRSAQSGFRISIILEFNNILYPYTLIAFKSYYFLEFVLNSGFIIVP
jgi:hypothetical protein